MTRVRWTWAMVAALLVAAACSDQPTDVGAGPGQLAVRLTTPHADDEALLFEVSGPVDSVSAARGLLQLFTRRLDDSTVVGAVVGPLDNGAIVTLHVPNVSAAAVHVVTVLEVADHEDVLRLSLAGYALTVTR
jgi:hypothetical protein